MGNTELFNDMKRALHDSEFMFKRFLKIRSKAGTLIPFTLKSNQAIINNMLDEQKKNLGYNRAIILKYRQGGFSSLVTARTYKNLSQNPGFHSLILGNKLKTSANLMAMIKGYHDYCDPSFKPNRSKWNDREIEFDFGKDKKGIKISPSSVYIGTTNDTDEGRSGTYQDIIGTEVGFWEHAADLIHGLLPVIHPVINSSVVWESTANGQDTWFYNFWCQSVAGETGYLPIFVPWFSDIDLVKDEPINIHLLSDEDKEYMKLYKLNLRQMAWRDATKKEYGVSSKEADLKFMQEFPANPEEAFMYSAIEAFIPLDKVYEACRRPQYPAFEGAILAGFDPAELDNRDRNAFVYRRGANVWGLEYPYLNGHTDQVRYLKRKLDSNQPYIDRLFIDYGGGGVNIHNTLINDGYGDRITLVQFGSGAEDSVKYANKRAEMAGRVKEALYDESMPLALPDDDRLRVDMTCFGAIEKPNDQIKMESKDKIRTRTGISPDGFDALGLTFAEKIVRKHINYATAGYNTAITRRNEGRFNFRNYGVRTR